MATPYSHSRTLSAIAGAHVSLKFESFQFTGSFKDRGALVKLLSLSAVERKAGVIAMSAGNHAQGVAHHARTLGIPATVVMPHGTPFVKVHNTEVLGATVLLEGETVDETAAFANAHGEKHGLSFIHPYDDARVIAGQGTIGLEILAADPEVEALIVPVGGGGLIAGIALAAKSIKPEIEIYGVQARLFPAMRRALHGDQTAEGGDSNPGGGQTFADGIAVKTPGTLTLPLVERLVEDILLVGEEQLERAVVMLLEIEKTVVEGAGAASLAALLEAPERFAGRRVGLVLSGGNIDPRILSSVILRGLVRAGRLVRLRISIPDRPGVLARVAQVIADTAANILEVHHERAFTELSVRSAGLVVVLETRGEAHVAEVVSRLEQADYQVEIVATHQSGASQ